jgi:hypothetical protein
MNIHYLKNLSKLSCLPLFATQKLNIGSFREEKTAEFNFISNTSLDPTPLRILTPTEHNK